MKICDVCGEKIGRENGLDRKRIKASLTPNPSLKNGVPEVEFLFEAIVVEWPDNFDACEFCIQFAIIRASELRVQVDEDNPVKQ